MNYLLEIKAFYDRLEVKPLSASGIALWYALMHINNKAGWAEEFSVPVTVLSLKSGLSERSVSNARNELKTKGYIDFRSRQGNRSAIYKLNSLSAKFADKSSGSVSGNSSGNPSGSVSGNVSALIKQDNTEQNNNSMPNTSESERKMLNVLADVKNYPFDFEKDLAYIRQLSVDFPELDIHEQLKSWATYKLDKPLTAKSNPRSQIRTWCQKAKQWGRGKKKKPQRAANGYWDLW